MNHAAYAAQVVTAMRAEQLALTDLDLDATPYRWLTLRLHPTHQPQLAWHTLEDIVASWDERSGWVLTLTPASGRATVLHRGGELVPPPATAAAWIGLAVTSPSWLDPTPTGVLGRDTLETDLLAYTGQ